jgi:hypothetical protein
MEIYWEGVKKARAATFSMSEPISWYTLEMERDAKTIKVDMFVSASRTEVVWMERVVRNKVR